MRVTKRVEFSAAHRYARADRSEAENRQAFGKAANLHGHNYILEVTVAGPVSPDTGMVMDLKALKDVVTRTVLDRLDHKNLNADVPELAGRLPTPEHVAVLIWELLTPALAGCRLQRVRLQEDETTWVDYFGERARA
jgi:6-pyruvoyltetrahydropterin/6-carboxytetrahydropterin synthase